MAGIPCSTAVKNFLTEQAKSHTHISDFVNHLTPGLELQINAAQDGGEEIDKMMVSGRSYKRFTDGITEWGMKRIPRNAGTEPVDNDFPLRWNLEEHAEGIGLTGWDWQRRRSLWVAFDFDSIVGHKGPNTLTDEELADVKKQAGDIPWVTIRRSTSGRGLHLYVYVADFEDGEWKGGVNTENHNEHAALARAILGKMSAMTDFDFQARVDACGGNMWIWHRKMLGTNGFELVKQGEVLYNHPPNWKDHLQVVKGHKKRARARYVDPDVTDSYEELIGAHSKIKLDSEHKKLISHLDDTGALYWWDSDRHMLVCHTYDLYEAHKALEMRGIFETVAQGAQRGSDQNCFAFPLVRGGWVVRRHTKGVSEHSTWDQDGSGWTRAYYNVEPDISTAARSCDAVETPKGGWVFRSGEEAIEALKLLGIFIELPQVVAVRQMTLKEHKDGRLIAEIEYSNNDPMMPGWAKQGKKWVAMFQPRTQRTQKALETESLGADRLVRHLIDEGKESAGWVIKSMEGDWHGNPLTHVKSALQAAGYNTTETTQIIGSHVLESWKLVNLPFQPEYPGNREWNREAAQLRFTPNPNKDNLKFPTWSSVLQHCGHGLNDAIKHDPWCVANGIKTGAEYLLLWVSSLFQFPERHLPYLFFYSPEQDSGKSTFYEALCLLMTKGYCAAENSLTNDSGFNGELAGCILAFTDEFNVAANRKAREKIKLWVTSPHISIRALYQQPYMARNCTHWVQCANDVSFCPVFPGDTRIVVIRVPPIDPVDMIPKVDLMQKLEREAPDFLRAILDLEIPDSKSRLNVPVVTTTEKLAIEDYNKSPVAHFIDDNCYQINGHIVNFGDFVARAKMAVSELEGWSKKKFTQELDLLGHPVAKISSDPSNRWIGNLAWIEEGKEKPKPGIKYVKDGYKITQNRS